MKGTLRKTNEGIVFTINEIPKMNDYYLNPINAIGKRDSYFMEWGDFDILYKYDYKIIASTFGVGLELYMLLEQEMDLILPLEDCLHVEFNTEYSYKIEDGKVIIEI